MSYWLVGLGAFWVGYIWATNDTAGEAYIIPAGLTLLTVAYLVLRGILVVV